ncbi:phytoene desaturase family protein [Romboutsia sedimentorum]|uniref:Phytoene desaturase family protein n=1 Tax=Romboutsia sedimentorum TaxID=1368474 RepID=A0ABT7EC00_9FIRM|nr:phytoene desaturase family protein [Romboutsia sedimentorum]MDK2564464.1 phytoene desaturase family protein [Romboutsia sedimentorum]
MKSVITVGAGIGGLCTAIRLLKQGYKVTILEKEKEIGGKVNIKNIEGATFDLTASILMTPKIYTEIFDEVGKDYKDYFELIKIDPIYRVNYHNGDRYDFYSDLSKMVRVLEHMQEGLSIEYLNFTSKSLEKYIYSKKYFLDKSMTDINDVSISKSLKVLSQIKPFTNVNKYVENIISNKQLKEYLIFQSMYIGINPYTSSNLYTLIPAISHTYGLWYIKGGFYKYIEALKKLILELGGVIETENNVEKILIHKDKIVGVESNKGIYKSDIVVCNADYPYAITNLINKGKNNKIKKIKKEEYSCSIFIMYLGLNKKYDDLQVHNMYIGDNFKENIESSFKGKLPKSPSIYLYYPSKIDESVSGSFESILNIMVRVPNLEYKSIKWNKENIRKFRNIIINQLKNVKGLENLNKEILYESYLTPIQLKRRFNSYNGTAFGISHKLNQTTYFRPHINDENTNGLYFIGSSTHPGNGVSVIIDGSKLVCDEICKKYDNSTI